MNVKRLRRELEGLLDWEPMLPELSDEQVLHVRMLVGEAYDRLLLAGKILPGSMMAQVSEALTATAGLSGYLAAARSCQSGRTSGLPRPSTGAPYQRARRSGRGGRKSRTIEGQSLEDGNQATDKAPASQPQ